MRTASLSEDDFLLSSIRRGEQKAFDALFRKYYPILCAYGHRFIDLEDAEENSTGLSPLALGEPGKSGYRNLTKFLPF